MKATDVWIRHTTEVPVLFVSKGMFHMHRWKCAYEKSTTTPKPRNVSTPSVKILIQLLDYKIYPTSLLNHIFMVLPIFRTIVLGLGCPVSEQAIVEYLLEAQELLKIFKQIQNSDNCDRK